MKYIKIYENFDFNDEDFDIEEENGHDNFDFILDDINKFNNLVIFILPKSRFDEFKEYCKDNNIFNNLEISYYDEDDKMYIYVTHNNGYLDVSYMDIENEGEKSYNEIKYPNYEVFKVNENFDFNDDDFDFEEDQPNDINIIGKNFVPNKEITIEYWNVNKWEFTMGRFNRRILDVKHASDAKTNPSGSYDFEPIPDDCYVFSVQNHWPWFKFDKELLKYIK